ncbi:5'/3'-nucleotidase SurE [Burkholderia ubonensis]|uniref:5'/3'-nucleotidase SurE n=1 Tax=Burkholderia ubonensis TaxID=101571 RepID=UPI000BA5AA32|nr:5'/3'-nucleotidase SurE [Burkholderia ubonensis]PAK16026.1 5'/3'-nucleotidase SurE [Burkholderia ubonensis]RQP38888.1 5'/3'-nucleotidase SurE [Burkholderia ubonensis]RQP39193.1 5'/3'-nucleotidase SurE [Burkholderia ubonensis]RQP44685.1 5'/3'-nucleotidase SurE [Burkholderia ubonensis]RQP58307.1 5'/3'-nucleotidase SurE [Burkholderia ubonensis]
MSETAPIFNRVLLTNDDGYDAPGLKILEQAVAALAREVWVVAPAEDQSGTSHSLSLHEPLRVHHKGERRFAVRGTPGDCVAVAVGHLMEDARPDLVLSGVNRGANLGTETVFSGTVGAAMTSMLLGVPAIALSQAFTDRESVPWNTALEHAPNVIRQLAALGWERDACLNVNFPAIPAKDVGPIKMTSQGAGVLQGVKVVARRDPRELDYYWLKLSRAPREDAADSETVSLRAGHITITPLKFERTHEQALSGLRSRHLAGEQKTSDGPTS